MPPDASALPYRTVASFAALRSFQWSQTVNAVCWQRTVPGDYAEVVAALEASAEGIGPGITPLTAERLQDLPLTAAGKSAVEQMLSDLSLLRDHGLAPELNCLRAYPREDEPGIVPIDVYSFHADSAPLETDTWLCTYHGRSSEGLAPGEARRKVDVPAIRDKLLAAFGGPDDDAFAVFLQENCYDLHYAPLPGATPFSFGVGNLWRITTDWPGAPVPPCVHRAPETVSGDTPRLLLIS